jgi:hypothetical protein
MGASCRLFIKEADCILKWAYRCHFYFFFYISSLISLRSAGFHVPFPLLIVN